MSADDGRPITGRVCGADFDPIDASHPLEWVRGKVSVELVFDPADLPGITIGSTWLLISASDLGKPSLLDALGLEQVGWVDMQGRTFTWTRSTMQNAPERVYRLPAVLEREGES